MAEDSRITAVPVDAKDRPSYEPPRIQVMSEKDILNTFQITQSMSNWWVTSCC
jgi:hypothetical protein